MTLCIYAAYEIYKSHTIYQKIKYMQLLRKPGDIRLSALRFVCGVPGNPLLLQGGDD